MSRVYVKFPKTGLGNRMLVWARGAVFAHLNQLPLIVSPWWGIQWGAWRRNEKKKRLYWGYFTESSWAARMGVSWSRAFYPLVIEPPLEKIAQEEEQKLFLFQQAVVQNDLFEGLRDHRDWLRDQLLQLLHPSLKRRLAGYEFPEIAVHIRRGDFKLGNPVTPQHFYVACIEQVRATLGTCLAVTVFTDAGTDEIFEVLALPNVKLADEKPDILDIILMSRARVIILSQSSTFSYWAAFLSDGVIIKPSADWQKMIRKQNDDKELPFDCHNMEGKKQLAEQLERLKKAAWH